MSNLFDIDLEEHLIDAIDEYKIRGGDLKETILKNLSFSKTLYNVSIEDVKVQFIDKENIQVFIKTSFKNYIKNINLYIPYHFGIIN